MPAQGQRRKIDTGYAGEYSQGNTMLLGTVQSISLLVSGHGHWHCPCPLSPVASILYYTIQEMYMYLEVAGVEVHHQVHLQSERTTAIACEEADATYRNTRQREK